MKIAVLASAASFEAEIAVDSGRRASFENSAEGVRLFERWALDGYRRGDDITVVLWDAEVALFATPLVEQLLQGRLTFRSWLPWRSANGVVSVDHVGHSTATEYSRRFGYEALCLDAVVRRAKGEFPSRRDLEPEAPRG
ncbi:hypothetical protein [Mitsuaria sp. GD03876]|uniref:hypothetical protein n=1 Tax=Mitsuaria sp. GD03876 TaxID=2975399 RepID=UPI002448C30C|nr:hypothetical protein [Mitsuaria sp. GD03876]MDH0865380.1 hypothetical protein [Mitsuaria sp. GD03876]